MQRRGAVTEDASVVAVVGSLSSAVERWKYAGGGQDEEGLSWS